MQFVIKGYGVKQVISSPYFDDLEEVYNLKNDDIIPQPTVVKILEDIYKLYSGIITPSDLNLTSFAASNYIESMVKQLKNIAFEEELDLTSDELDWYYVR